MGSVKVDIEVVAQEVFSEQRSARGRLELGGAYAPPPDLDLRVIYDADPPRLRYIFHSPAGTVDVHYRELPSIELRGPASSYFRHLQERLETLNAGLDAGGEPLLDQAIANKFETLGHNLYRELFPSPVRELYRRISKDVTTLTISSNEPWIPWELVKPYDDTAIPVIDDDFLSFRFRMTRWLLGESTPPGEVLISAIAVFDSFFVEASGEQQTPSEHSYFAGLAETYPGLIVHSPHPVTHEATTALLETGGHQLLHFAAHGEANPDRIAEMGLLLPDGSVLRAEDLHGRLQTRLRADRPLVFLNACSAGLQGWDLTHLGGWATVLVEHCRCSAFIAPLWAVENEMAALMAQTFYDALAQRRTIGEAAQEARRAVRAASPFNSTWLAYSVYAQPNARVILARK